MQPRETELQNGADFFHTFCLDALGYGWRLFANVMWHFTLHLWPPVIVDQKWRHEANCVHPVVSGIQYPVYSSQYSSIQSPVTNSHQPRGIRHQPQGGTPFRLKCNTAGQKFRRRGAAVRATGFRPHFHHGFFYSFQMPLTVRRGTMGYDGAFTFFPFVGATSVFLGLKFNAAKGKKAT